MSCANILKCVLVLPTLLLSLNSARANRDAADTTRLVTDLSVDKISIEANFTGEKYCYSVPSAVKALPIL